ncbi:unnamed protein product [Rangifer tarandus platyrhynchus]|uniref:Uncharacterized protein n=1 Tax=Rangifer tarandus platyrhynchus TaxID=3082113 RepID=A0ABN8Y063_RANTA|nr:unnamed protein product [Rangifer tarandus platyrhynchus]
MCLHHSQRPGLLLSAHSQEPRGPGSLAAIVRKRTETQEPRSPTLGQKSGDLAPPMCGARPEPGRLACPFRGQNGNRNPRSERYGQVAFPMPGRPAQQEAPGEPRSSGGEEKGDVGEGELRERGAPASEGRRSPGLPGGGRAAGEAGSRLH